MQLFKWRCRNLLESQNTGAGQEADKGLTCTGTLHRIAAGEGDLGHRRCRGGKEMAEGLSSLALLLLERTEGIYKPRKFRLIFYSCLFPFSSYSAICVYIQLLARNCCSLLPWGALLCFLWNSEQSHFFVLSPTVVKKNSNLNTLQEVYASLKKKMPYGQEYCAVISSVGFTDMKFSQQLQSHRLRMDSSVTLDQTRLKTRYRLPGP